jgi:hypothetical protein
MDFLAGMIAFITEHSVEDRSIDHLKLTFVAAKPPPSHVFTEVALVEAEENGEYFYHPNMLFELDFRVIDIAERPEVYCQCGQVGRFIGRRGNLSRRGKRNYLSFYLAWYDKHLKEGK